MLLVSEKAKNFLRSVMSEGRLSALTVLSVENVTVENIIDFYDTVIDKSAYRKGKRMHSFTNKIVNG